MLSYAHPQGLYHFRYPAGWKVSENNTATLVKSPGDPGMIGVFGIVRIKDEQTLHDAILNDVKARSGGVSQTDATAWQSLHAVKLVVPKKDDLEYQNGGVLCGTSYREKVLHPADGSPNGLGPLQWRLLQHDAHAKFWLKTQRGPGETLGPRARSPLSSTFSIIAGHDRQTHR